MKQYLTMADVFADSAKKGTNLVCGKTLVAKFVDGVECEYSVHAINSHDELVAMNKELLAALELMLLIHDEPSGFCGKFGKELDMAIEDQKEKIDTRIAVAINAIAKAKAAS